MAPAKNRIAGRHEDTAANGVTFEMLALGEQADDRDDDAESEQQARSEQARRRSGAEREAAQAGQIARPPRMRTGPTVTSANPP